MKNKSVEAVATVIKEVLRAEKLETPNEKAAFIADVVEEVFSPGTEGFRKSVSKVAVLLKGNA